MISSSIECNSHSIGIKWKGKRRLLPFWILCWLNFSLGWIPRLFLRCLRFESQRRLAHATSAPCLVSLSGVFFIPIVHLPSPTLHFSAAIRQAAPKALPSTHPVHRRARHLPSPGVQPTDQTGRVPRWSSARWIDLGREIWQCGWVRTEERGSNR